MHCYLFDIDGTIADLSHRLHHIAGEFDDQGMVKPKNWEAFFSECDGDAPIPHMHALLHHLGRQSAIVYVTGRSSQCREATINWLKRYQLPEGALYMRKEGDHRPDNTVKGELLDRLLAENFKPIMAFEDRDQVVKMWRGRGIPCCQVAEGNF